MMTIRSKVLIVLLIALGSFLAGYLLNHGDGGRKAKAERRILHYVDPMNPALKSDKPGIAPCGMPLEPVYADQSGAAPGEAGLQASMPPGTIRISPEKQQLIGVKTATVEKVPWSHTLRVLGRVTTDETRTYRINAAVNGWIEEAMPVTTGSLVKENEVLATYYSLEYRNLVQNYFSLINVTKQGSPGEKAVTQTSQYSTGQLKQLREAANAIGRGGSPSSQIDYYRRSLYNYGMSPYQVEEMERTRIIPDIVEIRAPIAGFILARNVSPGLRFDRGVEFFRIADLSRVWILADIFETEAAYFKAGMRVKMELPYQKRTLSAEVSPVLPQFDPATRTLKVRLVADNPGYVMRPDMFVNVELTVQGAPAVIVPVDAVLDSGLKKTVFVDKGGGFLEPRQVETGRTLGERVEISRGLMPGEKIVVSGNFLIDSEARMQQAASGIMGKIGSDPVCRMNIDEDHARAAGYVRDYKGQSYFFCTAECRDDFAQEPERYLKSPPVQRAMPKAGAQDVATKHTPTRMQQAASGIPGKIGRCPVCGMNTDEDRARAKGNFFAYRDQTYFFCDANDRKLFRKDPERYLKLSPAQGAMPVAGARDAAAEHASHTDVAAPRPRGAKTAPDMHEGMMMHGSSPGTVAMPRMDPQAPASPSPGNMTMPQSMDTTSMPGMPGEKTEAMPQPMGATPMPGMPGGKTGAMPQPMGTTSVPGMPGEKAGSMPREAAPLPATQPGEIAPQKPVIPSPKINPRYKRYLPGPVRETAPQEAAPGPETKTGGTPPSATGAPEVKP